MVDRSRRAEMRVARVDHCRESRLRRIVVRASDMKLADTFLSITFIACSIAMVVIRLRDFFISSYSVVDPPFEFRSKVWLATEVMLLILVGVVVCFSLRRWYE